MSPPRAPAGPAGPARVRRPPSRSPCGPSRSRAGDYKAKVRYLPFASTSTFKLCSQAAVHTAGTRRGPLRQKPPGPPRWGMLRREGPLNWLVAWMSTGTFLWRWEGRRQVRPSREGGTRKWTKAACAPPGRNCTMPHGSSDNAGWANIRLTKDKTNARLSFLEGQLELGSRHGQQNNQL